MNLRPDVVEKFVGKGYGVGGDNGVIQFKQRVIGRGRLLFKNVDGGTLYPAFPQGFCQHYLIDNRAAGSIYQESGLFHSTQLFFADKMTGGLVQRATDTDEV